jgi:hypothetical protein
MDEKSLQMSEKPGSLAWLELQGRAIVDGWELPACHRLPEGARIHPGEADGRCRVVVGENRCRGTATRRWGVCLPHAGGGGQDYARMSASGNAAKARLSASRRVLGIGARRIGDPRQVARVRAVARAAEVASALVDAPLDDASLGTIERQQAVVRMLGETFPLATLSATVELPADADDVPGMSWAAMQALGERLPEE